MKTHLVCFPTLVQPRPPPRPAAFRFYMSSLVSSDLYILKQAFTAVLLTKVPGDIFKFTLGCMMEMFLGTFFLKHSWTLSFDLQCFEAATFHAELSYFLWFAFSWKALICDQMDYYHISSFHAFLSVAAKSLNGKTSHTLMHSSRKTHPRINYREYVHANTVFVHARLMSPYCRSSCDVSLSLWPSFSGSLWKSKHGFSI